ncbi:MAG: BamA/TamA family outer membrane protein [Bacteroidota bacterium]
MKHFFSTGIIIIFLLSVFRLSGQHSLNLLPADHTAKMHISRLNYNNTVKNADEARQELMRTLQYFYEKGYLTASIDSIIQDTSATTAWIFTGEVYHLARISPGNANHAFLKQSGYKEKLFADRPFNPHEIEKLTENILRYCENNGYPFAWVSLDSVLIRDDREIYASLKLELNQKVSIDTIIIKGDSKLHRKYIRNYFNIKKGDLYNESRIGKIESKMQDLPFVSMIRPPEVAFMEDKAKLILFMEKKRASQFDGILGIAPNEQTTGKLLLTGDIKLKLMSAFNRGELIDLNWRKLEANTQDLNFHFNFPFLFSTPFGFDYQLQLFKKDTSYFTLSNKLGVQIMFNGYNKVKAYYENRRSDLLHTEGLEFATVLPDYADITTSLYGIGIDFNKLDYRYNPRKGYHFDINGAVGSKKIRKNANVNQLLYDSIPLNSTLYRLELEAGWFIPLFRGTTFLIANKSGFLENKNLFDNELFRIGGLMTLRGFDEESINASTYSVFTLEFRYLMGLNSYFHLFFDGAYYERNANSGYVKDTPFGFGAGVNFETPAGIFALSYALGSMEGQAIQFRSAKIHFGLRAKF